MAGLRRQRRLQLIAGGLVLVAVAAGLMVYAFTVTGAAQFFRAPSEVAARPPDAEEVFRIGGLVEAGSLVRGQGETISFRVTDTSQSVEVRYTGILPDLFKEGQGVIATGRLVGGVFEASEVLAKHDEKYMPREVVDALKDQGVYQGN